MTIPPSHPDRVSVYKDKAGEWRWRRINGHNAKIVADGGEGYTDREFCIEMALAVNGGDFLLEDGAAES